METNGNGNSSTGIIISVVIVAVVLLATVIFVWFYRRKTGRWPKPCKRKRCSTNQSLNKNRIPSQQPSNSAGFLQSVGAGHKADYRNPTPQSLKKVYSVTEKISDNLHNASGKFSKSEEILTRQANPFTGNKPKMSRSISDDAILDGRFRNMQRSVLSYSGNIELYQDRTLPTTLMMTPESKKQKFENEDTVALKRSNSAVLRSSSDSKTFKNPNASQRPDSSRLQTYNDFGPGMNLRPYKGRRKVRKTSNLSSHLSSKPSNTSDYVSDFETVVGNDRTWKTNDIVARLHSESRSSRYFESDSVLQDTFSLKHYEHRHKRKLEFQPIVPPISLFHIEAELNYEHVSSIQKMRYRGETHDDRTESQQNTMRSDAFYDDCPSIADERSCADGQSSDTESMVASALISDSIFSQAKKPCKYASDSELPNRKTTGQPRTRRRKHGCRSQSVGQESNVHRSTSKNKRKNRNQDYTERTIQGNDNLAFESLTIKSNRRSLETNNATKKIAPKNITKNSIIKKHVQSKEIIQPAGTIMEMPIYSHTTWSTPAKSKFQEKFMRKADSAKNAKNRFPPSSKKTRYSKKPVKSGRKLSIGGGGRYICEYGSLPVDLSKLPKDLVAKLGGQTDRLMEPIEHLNFDEICRPMPQVSQADGELSARLSVVDHLPPNHRDREVFSNTYKYEGTDLVMTDL